MATGQGLFLTELKEELTHRAHANTSVEQRHASHLLQAYLIAGLLYSTGNDVCCLQSQAMTKSRQ